jgi:F0F1-type ATP synthase assembly protein I
VLFGLWIGQWLDRHFALYPWLTLVGLGFGTAAGVRTLIRAMRRAKAELDAEDRDMREARRKYHEQHQQR